ncbi:hypothetical protein [Paenibacillus sp. OSY-SE]|uniref:hypothetical protein n=1 Tax=Paenibacillus sp. OSY-SE TaxID=1196323 RepID=UPI0002F5703B|nr:hypothetical protein [Paenibacillus sp. OSY-SE]
MVKTLHFQLSSGYSNEKLTLYVGMNQHPLQAHTEATLQQAALSNRALALLPAESRKQFTHLAEVPNEHFPTDRLRRIRVTSPDDSSLDSLLPAGGLGGSTIASLSDKVVRQFDEQNQFEQQHFNV